MLNRKNAAQAVRDIIEKGESASPQSWRILRDLEEALRWKTPDDWVASTDLVEFETASGRHLGFGPTMDADYWETDHNRVMLHTDVRRWRRLVP